jgi:hypothetical protein
VSTHRALRLTSIATLALFAALTVIVVQAHSSGPAEPPIADEAAIEAVTSDPCAPRGMRYLPRANRCTHGPDRPPPGVDITRDVPPLGKVGTAAIQCDGDGSSGKRTHVLYVRASDKPDRYAQYVGSIRQWATEADDIYAASAAETGGNRRVRFVHDAGCVLTVGNVVLSSTGDDNFDNTINQLMQQGYDRSDRKYMLFVDANVYCGIGTLEADDEPGQGNLNNGGPSWGRSDTGCWTGRVAAHEHMHNLGGVQLSAPNTSGGYHCVDEYDVMCYSDSPYFPPMQYPCGQP